VDAPVIKYQPKLGVWVVREDYTCTVDDIAVTVPAGFATDLASVPWLLRGLINTFELGLTAPIVHDYCYVTQGLIGSEPVDRAQADRFFAALMFADRVAIWRIACAYYAVRAFGWIWWRE
jgi:Protein of unknown function (DUF1353)